MCIRDSIYPNRSIREIEFEEKKENINVFDIFDEDDSEEALDSIETTKSEENKNLKSLWDLEKEVEDSETEKEQALNEEALLYREEYKYDLDISKDQEEHIEKNFLFNIEASQIDEGLLNTRISGVLFKTYILLENQRDGKVFVVDQHAAHERVNYEKFLKMYLNSEISSQILIKPEIIELNQLEYDKILNYIDLFTKLGFKIEDFGDRSVVLLSLIHI